MRIIHLTDIHLSSSNLEDLENFFIDALIKDLKSFHEQKKIDIILISGDLVDKGGDSISDCYSVFESKFTGLLSSSLSLAKESIVFVPGNHDIDRSQIEEFSEKGLLEISSAKANEIINHTRDKFDVKNLRIKKYKDFEKEFHSGNANYTYSNNESTFTYDYEGTCIGFALINDSWRCSKDLKKENHFIGANQIFNASKILKEKSTKINIAVFHHPFQYLNEEEEAQVKNNLESKGFSLVFCGHSHKHNLRTVASPQGSFSIINGRSAFGSPNELSSQYQPGYNIVDLNLDKQQFIIQARKFIRDRAHSFDLDSDSLPNGVFTGDLNLNKLMIGLSEEKNQKKDDLPHGYTANVNRIVRLLIGESLYPDKFVFVRELVQNSVDACDRKRCVDTYATPRITLKLNTSERFFEITDEGDGMTKDILKKHFSVIGNSVTHDFNSSNGNFNLISKFGIGFISIFIVAEKVAVSTKTVQDGLITFEINSVFENFKYNSISDEIKATPSSTGTTIRVYLKSKFCNIPYIKQVVKNYCRHISNLEMYVDDVRDSLSDSWNTEGAEFLHHDKTLSYELALAIGQQPRTLVSSNCGFMLARNHPAIIPSYYPNIIYGEVNFLPNAIDFDMSRTSIIPNSKSEDFKKTLLGALPKLFSKLLYSQSPNKELILRYLSVYLCQYNNAASSPTPNFTQVYSKPELSNHIVSFAKYNFQGHSQPLSNIISELARKGLKFIYITSKTQFSDSEIAYLNFLQSSGNFVVRDRTIPVQFYQNQLSYSEKMLFQILSPELGLRLIDLDLPDALNLDKVLIDLSIVDKNLSKVIEQINVEYNISLILADFDSGFKHLVATKHKFYLNYNHPLIQAILSSVDENNLYKLKTYLLGMLGLVPKYKDSFSYTDQ